MQLRPCMTGPGANDPVVPLYCHVRVSTGHLSLPDQTIGAVDFSYIATQTGHPNDGVLGGEVFKNAVVEMNLQNGTATFMDEKPWDARKFGTAIPFELLNNSPIIQAEITLPDGTSFAGKFLVDTGLAGSTGLVIFEPVTKLHPQILQYANLIPDPAVQAVGGNMEFLTSRIPQIQIGPFSMKDPLVLFAKNAHGIYADPNLAGSVGVGLLSRFDVVFDYGEQQMFLQPELRLW